MNLSNLKITNKATTEIQKLAKKIEGKIDISDLDIQNCLTSNNDVYDLFIIEKAITTRITELREEKNIESYLALIDIQSKAFKRIETFAYAIIFLVFIYMVIIFGKSPINKIVTNWDYLEPIAYIIDKLVIGVIILTGVVITTKIQTLKRIFKNIVLTSIFRAFDVDYSKYRSLIKKIQEKQKHNE